MTTPCLLRGVPVLLLGVLALSASTVSAAEIAIFKSADVAYYNQAIQAFRETLPPNTAIAEYSFKGNLIRGREIATSLRAAPPALVLAVGLKAALAAKLELVDTPVVFCLVLNPESHGLPAPNMTGILMRVPPTTQLASIQTLAPHARRVGLLYDPSRSGELIAESERAARKLGLQLITVPVENPSDVPGALRRLLPTIDLFWLLQDQTVITEDSMDFIVQTTLETKVPMFGFSPTLVQQGALGALVINARDIGRQAGHLATALLQGGSPSRQPLQDPAQPQLALNLNSAEYFGLGPSKEILRLATLLYGGPGAVAQRELPKDLIP
ncbi:MAG: ABC transporter substrate-binding protein [Nitrospira sp.]|nr:ABC transporter substrate-binding protein [Nitrospira sp.]